MFRRSVQVALLLSASPAASALTPPFKAWVDCGTAYIRDTSSSSSPIVGMLREGDAVTVTGCDPSCDDRDAWALLNGFGAVPLRLLKSSPEDEDHAVLSAAARYFYGTVREDDTPLYFDPQPGKVIERLKRARVLSFRQHQTFADQGWLEVSEGGFVRAEAIRQAKPSEFSGVHDPAEVVAFTIRKTSFRLPRAVFGPPQLVPRHTAFPVIEVAGEQVVTESGVLPRRDVRLAFTRRRPRGVSTDAAWVYVDLPEQTLTAYRGDKLVFSTLISSGRKWHETPARLFQVWLKTAHHRMSGHGAENYEVDEVPFAMFIDRGIALHGAFWHDAFGTPVSHGCINMSVADAQWLFEWSPPYLPDGWDAAIPWPSRRETLWVAVEKPSRVRSWHRKEPVAAPPLIWIGDATGAPPTYGDMLLSEAPRHSWLP